MDITEHILDEHHQQRQMFAELDKIDRDDVDALTALWDRLGAFLEVHAAAEEEVFYPELLKVGTGATDADSATEETSDAIADHNSIRDAVSRAGDQHVGSTAWWAAVEDARLANSEHMAEEERQGLADFRRHASPEALHRLAARFVEYVDSHGDGVDERDQDPDGYIRRHGS